MMKFTMTTSNTYTGEVTCLRVGWWTVVISGVSFAVSKDDAPTMPEAMKYVLEKFRVS